MPLRLLVAAIHFDDVAQASKINNNPEIMAFYQKAFDSVNMTLLGMSIGWLLGGVAVIEMVFSWPGIGNMAVRAISMRDYPLIEGFVLWISIVYMGINALVDLSYAYLDPRLKKEGRA